MKNYKKLILKHIHNEFSNTYELEERYRAHPSYCLLEIKNFLPLEVVRDLAEELDNIPLEDCKEAIRRGSQMYEHNKLDETPVADAVVHALHSSTFLYRMPRAA